MLPFVFPSIAFFLLPTCFAEIRAKRYSISCSHYTKDLTQSIYKILTTRCCGNCNNRIVENGKLRSNETYARYCQRRWRNYLVYWFWAWPACGVAMLFWHLMDSSAFEHCPHMIFLFGLIGAIATSWAMMRTSDIRYLVQALASAIVLVLGISVFFQ